jgi:hypothetical protein
MAKVVKIYKAGNSDKIHYTMKDAKKYALKYFGLGKEYILHSGLYSDGEAVFNSGKKLITKEIK